MFVMVQKESRLTSGPHNGGRKRSAVDFLCCVRKLTPKPLESGCYSASGAIMLFLIRSIRFSVVIQFGGFLPILKISKSFFLLYEAVVSPSDVSAFVISKQTASFLNRASLLGVFFFFFSLKTLRIAKII